MSSRWQLAGLDSVFVVGVCAMQDEAGESAFEAARGSVVELVLADVDHEASHDV